MIPMKEIMTHPPCSMKSFIVFQSSGTDIVSNKLLLTH